MDNLQETRQCLYRIEAVEDCLRFLETLLLIFRQVIRCTHTWLDTLRCLYSRSYSLFHLVCGRYRLDAHSSKKTFHSCQILYIGKEYKQDRRLWDFLLSLAFLSISGFLNPSLLRSTFLSVFVLSQQVNYKIH